MKQILLVTGGSRGIGAATCRLAADRGYSVAVNYVRQREAAENIVGEIHSRGGEAIAVQADMGEPEQIVQMFRTVDEQLGPLTALVNNAGILETQCRVEDLDASRLERIFRVNVTGSFLCAREAVRRMSTSQGGSGGAIVNVSSIAAKTGAPGEYVDYAAAKGAIDSFTRGLAAEVAQEGIRVNAVRPGFIDTEIHASGGEPNRIERVKQFVPLRRGGTAEEVAEAILFLLSPAASYTTGGFLDIAGGR